MAISFDLRFAAALSGALLLWLLTAGPGCAAADRWAPLADAVFQNFGTEDGLPNHSVTSVAEDRDGFLWIGTQGGVARWDGYRFRSYRPDPDDPGALPDAFVFCLHTDPQGRLWLGTIAGGLALYDRAHDRFKTYAAGPGGLSHVHVRAIADDGAGGLWVGTDGGLDHLDPATGIIDRAGEARAGRLELEKSFS